MNNPKINLQKLMEMFTYELRHDNPFIDSENMFLEKLVVQSSKHLETVLTMLLQIVQDMQLSSKAFAINILETISYMISTARRGRNIFCQVYGFETCLSLFTRFLGDFTNNYNDNDNNTIQDKEGKSLFFTSLIVKILQRQF